MMRSLMTVATFLGELCAFQAPASAKCTLTVESPSQVRFDGSSGAGYEGFNPSRYETAFSISISNQGSSTCNALLSVQRTAGTALQGPSATPLDYAVTLPGSLATIVDNEIDVGNPPNAIPVTIASGQLQVQHLSFQIPVGQIVASGDYHSTVLVRLLDTSDLDISAERSLALVTTVRPEMSVMLYDNNISATTAVSGAGSHHRTLDFGTLETGKEASLTVLVQSNDDYSMRISSPHAGALWHTVLGSAQKIAYAAFLGGRPLNLTSGQAYVPSARATGLNGISQLLRVRIGEVGTVHAGQYEDELTITVLPD